MLRISLLLVPLLLAGCSSGPSLPPLAPVSGLVTLDGVPLTRGEVQFVPDTRQNVPGPPAVGNIGPDGRYRLHIAETDGAVIGAHRIRVVARAAPRGDWDSLPLLIIPERYIQPETSGLTAEVKAGHNTIDLPLVSEVPPGRRNLPK